MLYEIHLDGHTMPFLIVCDLTVIGGDDYDFELEAVQKNLQPFVDHWLELVTHNDAELEQVRNTIDGILEAERNEIQRAG